MKMPGKDDAIRCLGIRERSKLGRCVSQDEHAFVRRMFEKYEDWYAATEVKVFNATVPNGTNVSEEDPLPDVYWEDKP